jgi:hypothetical protein
MKSKSKTPTFKQGLNMVGTGNMKYMMGSKANSAAKVYSGTKMPKMAKKSGCACGGHG